MFLGMYIILKWNSMIAAFVADFVYSVMTCVVDYMEAHLLSNKE